MLKLMLNTVNDTQLISIFFNLKLLSTTFFSI